MSPYEHDLATTSAKTLNFFLFMLKMTLIKEVTHFYLRILKVGYIFCVNEEGWATKTLSARNSIFLAHPFVYFMTSPSVLFVHQHRKKESFVHPVDLLLVINIAHQAK